MGFLHLCREGENGKAPFWKSICNYATTVCCQLGLTVIRRTKNAWRKCRRTGGRMAVRTKNFVGEIAGKISERGNFQRNPFFRHRSVSSGKSLCARLEGRRSEGCVFLRVARVFTDGRGAAEASAGAVQLCSACGGACFFADDGDRTAKRRVCGTHRRER